MIKQNQLLEISELIKSSNHILLVSHTNPDGDAVGSVLGMYHYLKKVDKEVTMMLPNMFPDFYSWLPDSDKILIYENNSKYCQKVINKSDLIFALDFSNLSRLGVLNELIGRTDAKKVLIDHHILPEVESFDQVISNTDISSTSELVFEFISALHSPDIIDKRISEALYTGIVTDTGSFSFSCNRPETYTITAVLISKGVDAQKIHKLIYDTFSENRLRLLGFAISERMQVWDELHTAIIYLTKDDLRKYKYQVGDTEGLVNYPLSIKHINVSVLVTEKDNQLRLSFRSKGDFSVNDLCRKHFNGGGHKNAAGGRTQESMNEFLNRLKNTMKLYINELDYNIEL